MLSFADFLSLLGFICIIIYVYFKWSFNYWKRRNVLSLTPTIPGGNIDSPHKPNKPLHILIGQLYDFVKSKNESHGGFYFFGRPLYIPVDSNIIRDIMSVDFNYFNDRGVYMNEEDDPLSAHLFSLPGEKWKTLRAKLTPTFTSGKMKNMFFIMLESAKNMIRYIDETSISKNGEINVKQVMECFTTDIIGSAAFGLDCNSFKDADSAFRYYGKRVFKGSRIDQLRGTIVFLMPKLAKALHVELFNKEVTSFFKNLIKNSIEYREKHKILRNDFLQLLIEMKNNEEDSLTFNEVAAQCFLFFLAGFETSSATMTFALYEMALNLDVQERARKEVDTVLSKYNGEITYESIMEMKYLQQVIDETLRKYPPLPLLNRKATAPYKVSGSDLVLDKGTLLFIPVYSIHRDPDYYPEPEKFDPDRFTEEAKQNRKKFTYMPFGDGPRNCIGLRFGLLQSKIGLCLLLKNYLFTMNPLTKVPVEFDPLVFVLASKDDIILNIKKIQ